MACFLYTSYAADERSSVDFGGRRIIKKKKRDQHEGGVFDERQSRHRAQIVRFSVEDV